MIVKRALKQLVLGGTIAVATAVVVVREVLPGPDGTLGGWPVALAVSAGVVLLVGIAACLAPTLTGLGIQPMEALRV